MLGAHVSSRGGVAAAPERGAELRATAIQLFTKTPNQWREPALADEHVGRFRDAVARHRLQTVVAHDSYLINLASPDPVLRARSIESFKRELERSLGRSSDQAPQKLKGIKTKPAPVSGVPVLVDCLGWVECRVVATLPAGDHTLVLGEIVAAGVEHDGEALTLEEAGFKYSG